MQTRRSIRKWKSHPVPEELLARAVQTAFHAPNSGGKQPYHCYIITNRAKIDAIGEAVQEVTDYLASLCREESDRQAVARWQKSSAFFTKAPALIAVSASIYLSLADKLQAANMDQPRVKEINKFRKTVDSRIQTVGAFVDHLLLALHALGLGAVYMAGPAQSKAALEKIIGMGEQEDFTALIPVGYADEQPAPPPRKPFDAMVTYIR